MSDLSRLREIAALLRPTPVREAKIPQGFDGLKRVIEDAMADLWDKLGEGGALEKMLDDHNLSDTAEKSMEAMFDAYKTFKKEVENVLIEAEGMIMMAEGTDPEPVHEMAAANKFQGGAFARKAAKQMIAAFKAGEDSFELDNGDEFMFDKPTNGGSLKKGDVVFAVHDKYNTGAELYEVLGFGGDDEKVKYDTVKAALAGTGTKSLKELEEYNSNQKSRDDEVRLIVKDLNDGSSGAWFYLHGGRWCYGSGAEPLSFSLVKKVG